MGALAAAQVPNYGRPIAAGGDDALAIRWKEPRVWKADMPGASVLCNL